MVLACRDNISLIRSEPGTSDLICVCIRHRLDKLGSPTRHIPETHVFHVRGDHRCLRPSQVNVVDFRHAWGGCVLTSLDVPRADRHVVTCRDEAPLVVVEADVGDEVAVARELLEPGRSLSAEEQDFVKVDRTCGHVLVIQRCCDVQHCLVQTAHRLELLAGACVP